MVAKCVDGSWQKTGIRTYDKDGAFNILDRTSIGSSEDLFHSLGVINLNDS